MEVCYFGRCFPGFLNCINGTKSRSKSHINQVFSKKVHIIAKECDNTTESISSRSASSLQTTISSSFISILFIKKQSGANFDVGRIASTALSVEAIFQQERFFRNNFITHYLSLIRIRKKIKYKRICINSFITHFSSLKAFRNKLYYTFFESYINQGQILIQENNNQQPYHTFSDSCSSQE